MEGEWAMRSNLSGKTEKHARAAKKSRTAPGTLGGWWLQSASEPPMMDGIHPQAKVAPPILTTSLTLLHRLREPEAGKAWGRFVDLYTPLLLTWARKIGLQPSDAADLVQELFILLMRRLPTFEYDPTKKNFRGWLRTVCMNEGRRARQKLAERAQQACEPELVNVPTEVELETFLEQEHNAYLVREALRRLTELKNAFAPRTVEICIELVVKQRPVAEVAAQFGVTENAAYIAKFRVLQRLRQELADFLD
jgi:RNA polymerase sigma-70 factor (ECF subfamily)